ncbi:hypothetical protein C7N43_09490 [Sphingobacteriales bacterium UPWRP_1]|nr:hypothetical protein B6N25_06895 [Sphingobacteriales bacterium TSM_CSS]PSJ77268.1 hypothetical protein C7N43_09490 [Sphingobacteriales bacterium UPWRP_1]
MQNHKIAPISLTFFLILTVLLFSFCREDEITTNPADRPEFSTDTLGFDTVFTTLGSTTKSFLLYNRHNKRLNISSVKLAGGSNSPFRINVDGISGTEINDVEVWANDSLYVFVEVTIDPNDINTPFVVEDSIFFETNGNLQKVVLVAWGQNAHFFGPGTPNGYLVGTTGDTTWTNDKPYVIFDGIIVDTLKRLSIDPGCQIFMHNGAILYVKGSLQVNGGTDTTQNVVFTGTRLEDYYDGIPGQWGGIYLLSASFDNEIKGAVIKNSLFGIRVDSVTVNNRPNLIVGNSIIRDVFDSGIIGLSTGIVGYNCLIYNCGRHNLQLEYGGQYTFVQCTFANYSNAIINHRDPIVRIGNYYPAGDVVNIFPYTQTGFTNCIIYGSEEEEVLLDDGLEGGDPNFVTTFNHCLLKTERTADNPIFTACLLNPAFQDTLFVSSFERDFRLNDDSPCINAGLSDYQLDLGFTIITPNTDLLGNPRNDGAWDMGCYEFTP